MTADAPQLIEVAPDVHAYVQPDGGWCLNNAGVVVGAAGSTIVAHEHTATDTALAGLGLRSLFPGVDWGETPVTPATVTFGDALTVRLGDVRVELRHVGPAHTRGDVVAWLPERRVLFTGDLAWSGTTPFVLMGSVSGSLRVLDELRALDPEVVVPGHGPIGGPELFDDNEAYLRWVHDLAVAGHAAGRLPVDVAREADLGAHGKLLDSERLVANLHRAYAEVCGAPPAAPIDLMRAMTDLATLNGGMPACHA